MSKPPPMGHNGGFAFDSRADIPSDVPRMFFFKFAIQDVLDDILRMPKEERGVYLTALIVMYKEMEGLPSDDKMAALSLGLDVREWRHIKPKLIARGVLYERPSGRISNRRFEAEISAYVMEYNNRREAAIERERRKKEGGRSPSRSARDRADIAERSPTYRADVAAISPTFPVDTGGDFSKKLNENNGATSTRRAQDEHEVAVRARDLLVTSHELEREVRASTHTNTLLVGASARDEIDPSEAPLDPKVAAAIRRLITLIPDEDEAYRIVESRSAEFAPEDWRDGIEDLARNRRTGVLRHPIDEALVIAYVRQAERNRLRDGIQHVEKPPPKVLEPGTVAEGIEITEGRAIVLTNGVRQEWLDQFGGNAQLLDLTLKSAAGRIKPNAPTSIQAQITSILAEACKDLIIRKENTKLAVDRQAERRNARPYVATPGGAAGEVVEESRADRMRRQMKERAAQRAAGGNGGN